MKSLQILEKTLTRYKLSCNNLYKQKFLKGGKQMNYDNTVSLPLTATLNTNGGNNGGFGNDGW